MPLYRHNDRAILLVHIPKTGGSSLEEMLVDAGALQALKFHKRLGYAACNPQHMHWEVLCRWVPKEFYNFSLAIVRNPYDRLASEYAWRAHISGKTLPEFNTWVRKTFKAYQTNPYIMDNHIRPQTEFVGHKVQVFRLEDGLDAAAKTSFRRLGLTYRKPATPHVRKSTHKLIKIEESVVDFIRDFYATDFEAYNYDPAVIAPALFTVVPDPVPEPAKPEPPKPVPEPAKPEPEPELEPVMTYVPPPAPPPAPLWRRLGNKVKRAINAANEVDR